MSNEELHSGSSGLLLDDPRQLSVLPQFELLFGGGAAPKKESIDWAMFMPKFRYQGSSMWCTAFSACNIGSAFNKKETGEDKTFSPMEMFYRTGGSRYGNTLVNAASGMCDGFVLEQDIPTPIPDSWSDAAQQAYKAQAEASLEMLSRGKPYKMAGFSVVSPTTPMLRKALELSPVMLAIGLGSNYWSEPAPRRTTYSAYHCVTLQSITPNGEFEIFESLTPRAGFKGSHLLANDYEILYALSFSDLPNDWHSIQEQAKAKPFANALAHYNQPRNLGKEVFVANSFNITIKKHPNLVQFAGSLWTVIINAIAYGYYTETDILNHLTMIRRTGKPIFDLNEKRTSN